jgi:hypothetical protein
MTLGFNSVELAKSPTRVPPPRRKPSCAGCWLRPSKAQLLRPGASNHFGRAQKQRHTVFVRRAHCDRRKISPRDFLPAGRPLAKGSFYAPPLPRGRSHQAFRGTGRRQYLRGGQNIRSGRAERARRPTILPVSLQRYGAKIRQFSARVRHDAVNDGYLTAGDTE